METSYSQHQGNGHYEYNHSDNGNNDDISENEYRSDDYDDNGEDSDRRYEFNDDSDDRYYGCDVGGSRIDIARLYRRRNGSDKQRCKEYDDSADLNRILFEHSYDSKEFLMSRLENEKDYFEKWLFENRVSERRENFWFWILKIPVIVATASAGLFTYFNWQTLAIFVALLGNICAMIETVSPRGVRRNAYIRAREDLEGLIMDIQRVLDTLEWGYVTNSDVRDIAIGIFEEIYTSDSRIRGYISAAEQSVADKLAAPKAVPPT